MLDGIVFFKLGTIDILDQILLCGGRGAPWPLQGVNSAPCLYPPDADGTLT